MTLLFRRSIFALLMAFFFTIPFVAERASADLDNKGKEFILGFLPNFDNAVTIELHLTSDVATNVTVEHPVNSPTFSTTVGVTPGTVTIVTLPAQTAIGWSASTAQNNLVRVSAAEEFVVYMVNRRRFSSDAALGLPVDTMNVNFIVVTDTSSLLVRSDRSEMLLTAATDSTTVTVTPAVNLSSGQMAGVPFDVALNRGEGFLLQGATNGPAGDLTGTFVSADRPIGMVNGNKCTNIPGRAGFCDHVFEVAQSVGTWDTDVLMANLPLRPSGSQYRVVASENGTTVMLDGTFHSNLNAGEFSVLSSLPGNHSVTANHPVFVAQFMTGSSTAPSPSRGDPAMGNMTPTSQFQTDYTFSTVGGDQFVQNFLTIIASDADVAGGTVLLDGSSIAAASFSSITGQAYSSATIALSQGTHTTSSSDPHGITVEGYNQDDSYLYPGGALFLIVNPEETDPPVCVIEQFAGPPTFALGSATDGLPTDTGISTIELDPSSTNVVLTVDTFGAGDPSATYRVDLVDPTLDGMGTVIAADVQGNFCVSVVDLGGEKPPAPVCDVNDDQQVDFSDIRAIFAARGQSATGPDDPRDWNGDGIISINDGRGCVLECTNPRCAP